MQRWFRRRSAVWLVCLVWLPAVAACDIFGKPTGQTQSNLPVGYDQPAPHIAWRVPTVSSDNYLWADSAHVLTYALFVAGGPGPGRVLTTDSGRVLWSDATSIAVPQLVIGDTGYYLATGLRRVVMATGALPGIIVADSIPVPAAFTVVGNTAYLADAARYAVVNRTTGATTLVRALPACSVSSCPVRGVAAAGDTLFVVRGQLTGASSFASEVLAIRLSDGAVVGAYADGAGGSLPHALSGTIVVLPTVLVVADGYGTRLVGVSRSTMTQLWTGVSGSAGLFPSPLPAATSGTTAYFSSIENVSAVQATTGTVLWHVLLSLDVNAILIPLNLAVCNGKVVVQDTYVRLLDPSNGNVVNFVTFAGWRSIAVGGRRLFALSSGEIVAFDC